MAPVVDGATLTAAAFVFIGLIVLAWLRRGKTGAGRTASKPTPLCVKDGVTGPVDVSQEEVLAHLIREADERIAELRSLCQVLAQPGESPADRGKEKPRDRRGVPPPETTQLAAVGSGRGPERPRVEGLEAHGDPLTNRVVEMSRVGKTPVQIAAELHEHTGKIELILALSRMDCAPGA